jgi:hypothetical protein
MRTIYFLPQKESLKGELFLVTPYRPVNPLGDEFRNYLLQKGVQTQTIDAWSPETHKKEDVLFVWGRHPEDGIARSIFYWLRWRIKGRKTFAVEKKEFREMLRLFSKKILYQVEVPINTPYAFRHLKELSGVYDKIFLFLKDGRFSGPKIDYFMAPVAIDENYRKYHSMEKKKFLVMVNSNVWPRAFFKDSLRGERLKAVRFFSGCKDFDLYGGRWDRVPYFPYWHYYYYARKAWRGRITLGEKLKAVAQYKFAVCFENCKYNGYMTEKIFDCIFSGTVPIYLGAPDITDYVPADCFIDMRNFNGYPELLRYLREMDEGRRTAYVERMRRYIEKERSGLFSVKTPAEKILKAISE